MKPEGATLFLASEEKSFKNTPCECVCLCVGMIDREMVKETIRMSSKCVCVLGDVENYKELERKKT